MKTAHSGRAAFTQAVTAPPKDGQAARTKQSSGHFEFQRPGRFSSSTRSRSRRPSWPTARRFWLYDADLNQVTQRAGQGAGRHAGAARRPTSPRCAPISRWSQPKTNGLQWVLATPKAREGQLKSVRVGFDGERRSRCSASWTASASAR
ncbi:MAG: outer-membrane lipoprotein carrier protein LolA [Paenacidovorax caeni]